ncbi:MAG TPA: N-acetyltransferase [Phototrophicaceae bacterium]|nr:N-acetyltransferase [Phototrophicaceae bacterium]
MTSSVLDLSHTDMPRQIQGNLIAYMRLFAGLPGMVLEDSATFWFISHHPAPGDVILRADLPDRIDERLDALFAEIGQHIDQIGWLTFPGDQPADLNERLAARGMPTNQAGHWLWADLKRLGAAPAVPPGFRIEQVRSDAQMMAWTRASEAGFGGEYPHFYAAYASHGYQDGAFSLHYIGCMKDVTVTSGTLLDAGGGATIYDISTPPAFRGQGFGGALTHYLMREIRQRGYAETWIWSSDMAQSLYRKLGYVDADFGIREHTWLK